MREVIPSALAGERVDRVVAMLTDRPRSEVAELVRAGAVLVNGRPGTASRRVSEGDILEVEAPPEVDTSPRADPDVAVPVVHVDEHVIVVDKPAGLVVHPGSGNPAGTLVNGLLARFPDLASSGAGDGARPGIVHRLDKGTSGLLVVARTAAAYDSLVDQIKRRAVDRRYLALVWGHVEAPSGLIEAPVGRAESDRTRMTVSAQGRPARTRYEVQARYASPASTTLLECRLETGRTHQIRVHVAAIGHPVVGDQRYGGSRADLPAPRPFLHAYRLGFDHPASGERLELHSPLPDDLEELRVRLH